MIHFSIFVAVAIVVLLVPTPSAANDPVVIARHGESVRGEVDGITFLVLRGTRSEQGEAHGVLAAKDILTVLDGTLMPQVEQRPGTWDAAILPIVRTFEFPDHYAAELDALLEGIQIALPNAKDRMLTSIGREISIDDLRALNCVGDIMSASSNMGEGGCSSFSAWGPFTENGAVISGRNLDYRTFPGRIPFSIIAREPAGAGRLATLDLSAPGTVGVSTAMNSEGITLFFQDEDGLRVETPAGHTPRPLVSREALEHLRRNQDAEAIVDLFRGKSVITGNNTHLVFPTRGTGPKAAVIEWDGNPTDGGAAIRLPDPGGEPDAMVCTNHYLRRRDPGESEGNTLTRYRTLLESITSARMENATIGLEKAKEMMDAVSVRGEGVTYLTAIAFPDERHMIFATTPNTGVPATEGRWVEVRWEEIFEAR